MMYFDQSSGVFKCYQKDPQTNQYGWVNCTAQGPHPGTATLTIPVQIFDRDGRLVLEITQE